MDEERDLIGGKRGATRLAFATLLKFYTQYGRFPRGRAEFPDEVVDYVAKQTKTSASSLGLYDWSGRTIERHRGEIRDHLGFRDCSVADANRRDEVEMTALCLRILQASLVMVNVLMLQDVLADPEWSALLTPVDRRGLTLLFWLHVRPYGEVRLDLSARLSIGTLGSFSGA
ncbi:DUF4158 domain-containing protein [Nonomuraea cavernae]|uniref:DUF4158 domain-containing protein n=1 Tax=Nonomuraea cavernae TaxID=2045107 RepID=UPI001CD9DEAA|nr:DUF4158 domain-containing protein [Nonomuraea cavernae]MCA2184773.1 DUF4158 domain-containing protein [Nonomuraea cavernae]